MGEVGQNIASGTEQLMQQTGNALGEGAKQIGNVANEAGNQIKKAFGNFPKLWRQTLVLSPFRRWCRRSPVHIST